METVEKTGSPEDGSESPGKHKVKPLVDIPKKPSTKESGKTTSAILTNLIFVGEGKLIAIAGSVDVPNRSGKKVTAVTREFLSGLITGTKGGVIGGGHL